MGTTPAGARGRHGLTDCVQVPPRARADVQEPQRSSSVRGARQHLADDTHGVEIQLTKTPIP